MGHISSIGAAMFSRLSVNKTSVTNIATAKTALAGAAGAQGYFDADTKYTNIGDVRSFPAIGNPANIVKVPVYGQSVSSSIQGQSDAPQLEIDINYIGADWAKTGSTLGPLVGNGSVYVFRFTLLNSLPTATGATRFDDVVGGVGTAPNSSYYWIGKLESLLVTPSLTDSTTAKLTLSLQSEFYGAYTI
jgi:hypothetical protein